MSDRLMAECATLTCLYNQMPDIGMDDVFVLTYLVVGFLLLAYLIYIAIKEY